MSKHFVPAVPAQPGRHTYISPAGSSMLHASYGRIRLDSSVPSARFQNEGQETGLICLSGTCAAVVDAARYELQAGDALYITPSAHVELSTTSTCDIVECSAPVSGAYPTQFIASAEVAANDKLHFLAGTPSAQREINILFGTNIEAGRLVAGITRSLPGNWTSWPPHEHAKMLEEIYVYVEMPAPAYGLQLVYEDEITPAHVDIVREGDAVLLPAGYHPNVAIPGHQLNFVWIMAAHREVEDRKWGVVNVDARFA